MKLQTLDSREQLERLARRHHWGLRDLERGELLTQTRFVDGWWRVPATVDSITNPSAAQRAFTILAGMEVVGFELWHETTRLLTSSRPAPRLKINWRLLAMIAIGTVVVAGAAYFLINEVAAGAVAATGALAAPAAATAVAIDPQLVVVLPPEPGSTQFRKVVVATWYH